MGEDLDRSEKRTSHADALTKTVETNLKTSKAKESNLRSELEILESEKLSQEKHLMELLEVGELNNKRLEDEACGT